MLQLFEKRFKCWGIDIFSHKLLKGFTLTQAVRCPSVYVCSTDPLYLQYKHSSLLRYGMNYDLRGFNSTTIGLIYLQCERSSLFRYGINYDLSGFNSTTIGLIYLQYKHFSLFRYGINYDLSMFNSTNIRYFYLQTQIPGIQP